jgi:hypothetical protein
LHSIAYRRRIQIDDAHSRRWQSFARPAQRIAHRYTVSNNRVLVVEHAVSFGERNGVDCGAAGDGRRCARRVRGLLERRRSMSPAAVAINRSSRYPGEV